MFFCLYMWICASFISLYLDVLEHSLVYINVWYIVTLKLGFGLSNKEHTLVIPLDSHSSWGLINSFEEAQYSIPTTFGHWRLSSAQRSLRVLIFCFDWEVYVLCMDLLLLRKRVASCLTPPGTPTTWEFLDDVDPKREGRIAYLP